MRKKKLKKRVLTVLVLVAVTLLVSAVLSKQIRPASANDEAYQRPLTQTEVFISQIGETARQLGQANNLYASVMIAQAILDVLLYQLPLITIYLELKVNTLVNLLQCLR